MSETIALSDVTLTVCDPCLRGVGGECHVPGCAFWMSTAPVGEVAEVLMRCSGGCRHGFAFQGNCQTCKGDEDDG